MRGLSVAEQGLCFIFDCFVKYQGTWTYVLLGIAAILLTLLYRKKEAEFLFLWYPLVLLLTVFNPFLMNKVIVKMDFESRVLPFFLAGTSAVFSGVCPGRNRQPAEERLETGGSDRGCRRTGTFL